MLDWIRELRSVFYEDILRRRKMTPFLIAVSFSLSFIVSRMTVMYGPSWLRLFIRSYHIHHFYYGFFLIAIANWIALTTNRPRMFNVAAVLFGIGMGLFMDEFGLLLTCTSSPALACDYFARQTYDASLIILGLLFAFMYSGPMFSKTRRMMRGLFSAVAALFE
jgi:hypothetical protein